MSHKLYFYTFHSKYTKLVGKIILTILVILIGFITATISFVIITKHWGRFSVGNFRSNDFRTLISIFLFFLSIPSTIFNLKSFSQKVGKQPNKNILDDSNIEIDLQHNEKKPIILLLSLSNYLFGFTLSILASYALYDNLIYRARLQLKQDLIFNLITFSFFAFGFIIIIFTRKITLLSNAPKPNK